MQHTEWEEKKWKVKWQSKTKHRKMRSVDVQTKWIKDMKFLFILNWNVNSYTKTKHMHRHRERHTHEQTHSHWHNERTNELKNRWSNSMGIDKRANSIECWQYFISHCWCNALWAVKEWCISFNIYRVGLCDAIRSQSCCVDSILQFYFP